MLVADLGSFRQAADRLSTTQPNISSRIASLENALGKKLMERDPGSVRLTAQGHELLGYARIVLSSMDDFIQAANGEAAFEGVIRLGVTEMVVHTWLRDFMKNFKSRFPKVLIELSVDLSSNLEADLAEQRIDLSFQSGPFARKASGELSLGTFPIVWAASPDIGLSATQKISPQELSQFPIITHAKSTRPYEEIAAHFGQWPELKTRLVPSTNLSASLQMTADGYGVAALLAPMIEQEINSGELIKLNYEWLPEALSFSARYDQQKSTSVIRSASEIAQQCANKFHQDFSNKQYLND